MPRITLPIPALIAGFIAVVIGYTSSAAIIWQAGTAAGASPSQLAGWFTMLGIGMGISTLALTLWYRIPILTAWSTPGAALLATSLSGSDLSAAVGIFLFSSALIVLSGVTGAFARLMRLIPHSLAAAMLAGILLRFGLATFIPLQGHFILAIAMLTGWIIMRALAPRYAVISALFTGIIVCLLEGTFRPPLTVVSIVPPVLTLPTFRLSDLLGVGLPFFLVTMASQNAPGIATLRASHYQVPVSPLITVTGLTGLLLAPFGVFSVCIAAISAAVCQNEEVHPNKNRRWPATAFAGLFYLLAGLYGGAVTSLLTALPSAFISVMAGLALLSTFSGSLYQAFEHSGQRDAAAITFLVTASGITLLGISAPFWGLVAGGISYFLLSARAS